MVSFVAVTCSWMRLKGWRAFFFGHVCAYVCVIVTHVIRQYFVRCGHICIHIYSKTRNGRYSILGTKTTWCNSISRLSFIALHCGFGNRMIVLTSNRQIQIEHRTQYALHVCDEKRGSHSHIHLYIFFKSKEISIALRFSRKPNDNCWTRFRFTVLCWINVRDVIYFYCVRWCCFGPFILWFEAFTPMDGPLSFCDLSF